MSLVKKVVRGAGWAMAGGYLSQVLALAMFLVVSRLVGPSAFGTVAVAIAIVELCRAITIESIAANLVAQPHFDEEAFNAGFALSMGGAILLTIALAFSAPAFAILFRTPDLSFVLPQIAILLIVTAAWRLQEARLTQQMRFRALAARAVAAALIGGAVGIGAAQAGLAIEALVWQQWANAATSLVLLWAASPWRPRFTLSRVALTKLAREAGALSPANLITNLSLLVDGLAAAAFAGPAAAGLYNLGKRVRLAMQIGLSSSIDRVALPAFAHINARAERLAPAIEAAMRYSTILAYPVFFGLAAIAPELIALCLGDEWSAAATPTSLLLIGGALAVSASYCENALLVLNHRRWIVAMRALYLAVLCIGLVAFGRLGADAIAGAALFAVACHCIATLCAVSHFGGLPLRKSLSALAVPFCASLAMLLVLMALRAELMNAPVLARLVIQIGAGALFYAGAVWLLARGSVKAMLQAARAAL